MASTIKIKGLSKKYRIKKRPTAYLSLREQLLSSFSARSADYFWALRDINIDIQAGECVGIIGRNGAGKSTLLKILSRITPPTKGYIKARGRVASLLEVGTGFHYELTGRENIFLNGSILGLKKQEIKSKFDEIVSFSSVEQFLDTPLKHYSSGMQLRLAFAVAAHLEPEILLIDEVLAVGDAAFQKKCIGKMDEVSKSGRTILFVSHDMGIISNMCNRGIVLNQGDIEYSGNIVNSIEYYNSLLDFPDSSDQVSVKYRKGNGIIRILQIDFLNKDEEVISGGDFVSGEKVVIRLKYEIADRFSREIEHLSVGFAIFNYRNQFVASLNNIMSNYAFGDVPKTGYIYCTLDRIPFMYGRFTFNLTVEVNHQLSDKIENAAVLNVSEGDYFLSGYNNAYKRSGVYIEQEWTIDS
ncbi:MAG: ABC transporter ATP-binding protein [Bacteroidota bacterium]